MAEQQRGFAGFRVANSAAIVSGLFDAAVRSSSSASGNGPSSNCMFEQPKRRRGCRTTGPTTPSVSSRVAKGAAAVSKRVVVSRLPTPVLTAADDIVPETSSTSSLGDILDRIIGSGGGGGGAGGCSGRGNSRNAVSTDSHQRLLPVSSTASPASTSSSTVTNGTIRSSSSDVSHTHNYEQIGVDETELHERRARYARLSSPLTVAFPNDVTATTMPAATAATTFWSIFRAYEHECLGLVQSSMRRQPSQQMTLIDFLARCARGGLRCQPTSADDPAVDGARITAALLDLLHHLQRLQRQIEFEPVEHVYYGVVEEEKPAPSSSDASDQDDDNDDFDVSHQPPAPRVKLRILEPYRMSVTKSLELLFGGFDADAIAWRLIQSQRWKSRSVYKELAFDLTGKQRSEFEVVELLKKRWSEARDKGTDLHAYIQSLTMPSPTAHLSTSATHTVHSAHSDDSNDQSETEPPVPRVTNEALQDKSCTASIEVDGDQQSRSRQRDIEWACLSQKPLVGGERPTPPTVLVERIDPANLEAFNAFNRRRMLDGWLLVASEYVVFDRDASLAGSIDAVYLPHVDRPDRLVLVDWKRCDIDLGTRYSPAMPGMRHTNAYSSRYPKCNYWKYAMQLNVYRELLERMLDGRATVVDMLIVSMPEGVCKSRVYSVPRLSDAQLFVDDLARCYQRRQSEHRQ